jgi:zinc transport system permease protein
MSFPPALPFAMTDWLDQILTLFSEQFPAGSSFWVTLNLKALLAVVLVSVICGAVSSLVIGNRMAFFSDALAHCALSGVAIGLLAGLALDLVFEEWFREYAVPLIMVAFGLAIGIGIAMVRERTGLSNDTVIGVFFAGAVGFGAMLFNVLGRYLAIKPEAFFFGSPVSVTSSQMLLLFALLAAEAILFLFMFNQVLFVSVNPVLARSRNISLQLCNYLSIALLALIVNLCLSTVGVLLINGLLIVPGATASNLARNMRQMFWYSVLLSLTAGLLGFWLSLVVQLRIGRAQISFGSGGVIVVLSVVMFFLSMIVGPWIKKRKTA